MIVLEQFVCSNIYMLKRTRIFFVNQIFLSYRILLVDRGVSEVTKITQLSSECTSHGLREVMVKVKVKATLEKGMNAQES